MIKVETLDPATPLPVQLQEKAGPVVVVNTFFVPKEVRDEFLTAWQADATYMISNAGFVSTQLHQGLGDSNLMVNVATWESTEALMRATANPKFQEGAHKFPDGVVAYHHVFKKIAVEGICEA